MAKSLSIDAHILASHLAKNLCIVTNLLASHLAKYHGGFFFTITRLTSDQKPWYYVKRSEHGPLLVITHLLATHLVKNLATVATILPTSTLA